MLSGDGVPEPWNAFLKELATCATSTVFLEAQTEFAKYATNNNHVASATTASAGFLYDNSGNVTNDGVNTYAYDEQLCHRIERRTQQSRRDLREGLER
jgi:hypothetical protein